MKIFRKRETQVPGYNHYDGPLLFGFGFVWYPKFQAEAYIPEVRYRCTTWVAFRSNKLQGPVCASRKAAFAAWVVSRFFPYDQ